MAAKSLTPAKKGGRKPGTDEFPLLVRLKARNLYLMQGMSHEVIAKATGLTVRQSETLASREGWAKLRKGRKLRLLASQDARASAQITEALEAIADVSEQHAVQGLDRVGQALESKGKFAARDFQSWTGGVRNLVQTAKICREVGAGDGSAGAQINVFVGAFPRAGDAAREAKQVTEVSATPVLPAPTSCVETEANNPASSV